MRNIQYRLYGECIHYRTSTLPEDQFDLIERYDQLTEFSHNLLATHTDLLEAMKDLANRRCNARLVPVCDGKICLADICYLEEVDVLDGKTDHCVMMGNRWFAEYEPATTT